jgi:hypothetical protein
MERPRKAPLIRTDRRFESDRLLPLVIEADDTVCFLLRPGNGLKQKRRENYYDRDNHQQLHERKAKPVMMISPGHKHP